MSDPRKRCPGFTLVELLVVIAVIAILASILFPVFLTAKQSAWRTKCASNMRQLGDAFNMYKADWAGAFPVGGYASPDTDFSDDWQNVTWKYVRNDAVYRCPASRAPNWDKTDPGNPGPNPKSVRAPVTYVYNSYLGCDPGNRVRTPHRESEVLYPTKCIELIEGNNCDVPSQYLGVDGHGMHGSLWLNDFTFQIRATCITGGDNPSRKSNSLMHHRDGANVLLSDGHIRFASFTDKKTLQAALPWLVHVPLKSIQDAGGDVAGNPWQ